jgi:hypothetical protein
MISLKNKLSSTLLALTIICILFAASSQLLGAPVPGGPGFVSIGSYEFRPSNPNLTYGIAGGRLYTDTGGTFIAPAHLPHGATITQIVLYFVDTGTSGINVYLGSYPLNTPNPSTEIASITTKDATPGSRFLVVNTFPNGSIIDNQSNFYFVSVGLPASSSYMLGGVRIDYSHPTNLPLIMK